MSYILATYTTYNVQKAWVKYEINLILRSYVLISIWLRFELTNYTYYGERCEWTLFVSKNVVRSEKTLNVVHKTLEKAVVWTIL